MKCERKPRFVDAIRWDGINTEKIKNFVPNIQHVSIVDCNHLFLINEFNNCYGANVGDYIVYDGEHTYTVEKGPFEEEYIIYES